MNAVIISGFAVLFGIEVYKSWALDDWKRRNHTRMELLLERTERLQATALERHQEMRRWVLAAAEDSRARFERTMAFGVATNAAHQARWETFRTHAGEVELHLAAIRGSWATAEARLQVLTEQLDALATAEKRRAEVWAARFDMRKDEAKALEALILRAWSDVEHRLLVLGMPAILAGPPSAVEVPATTIAAAPPPAVGLPGLPRVGAGPVPLPEHAVVNAAGSRLDRRQLRHATRDHEWAAETIETGMQDLRARYAAAGRLPTEEALRDEVLNLLNEVDG